MKNLLAGLFLLVAGPVLADTVTTSTDSVSISTYTSIAVSTSVSASIDISTSGQIIVSGNVGKTGFVAFKNGIPLSCYDLTDDSWKYGAVSDFYIVPGFPYLSFNAGGVKAFSSKNASFAMGAIYKVGNHIMDSGAGPAIRSVIPDAILSGGLGNTVIGFESFPDFTSDGIKLHYLIITGINITWGN